MIGDIIEIILRKKYLVNSVVKVDPWPDDEKIYQVQIIKIKKQKLTMHHGMQYIYKGVIQYEKQK